MLEIFCEILCYTNDPLATILLILAKLLLIVVTLV